MTRILRQHWFLAALMCVAIVGARFPHPFGNYADTFDTRWAVMLIMFLNGLTLETSRLFDALRRPLIVVVGVLFSFVFAAAFGYPASRLLMAAYPDFSVGLLVVTAMPTTLASGIIWTRMANGNDALSMVITVVGNSISFVLSPLILSITLGTAVALQPVDMMQKLFVVVVFPAAVAQALRRDRRVRERTLRLRLPLSVLAQVVILNIVFVGIVGGMLAMKENGGVMSASALLNVVVVVVAVHLLAVAACWAGGRAVGLNRPDRLSVIFNGSQKTLPAALYVCEEFFPAYAFAPIPCVLYHVCQLVADSWLVEWAKLRESRRVARCAEAGAEGG